MVKINPAELDEVSPEVEVEGTQPKAAEAVQANQTSVAGRNDVIFREACMLIRREWPLKAVPAALKAFNLYATEQHHSNFEAQGPLDERELCNILKSAEKQVRENIIVVPMSAEEALDFMNAKYSIVMDNGKTLVVHRQKDYVLNRSFLVRSSLTDIIKFHLEPVAARVNSNGRPIIEPLGKFWTQNPRAKKYSRLVFNPDHKFVDPAAFNIWQGFAMEAKKGDWTLLRLHIYENVCSKNDEWFQYFMGWLARMIQEPASPGEVAIALRGGKGTGKSILFEAIGKLIGQHFLHISSSRHLVGNFNAHLQDTLLLFSDEAFWAADKAGESTLKALITEKTILIEPKGVNAYSAPNYLHIVMASNADWVVPFSKDERRFFVLDVSDARQGDTAYFGAIVAQLKDGGYQAMLYDLLHWDISNFNVRKIPETSAMREQKTLSLDATTKWILDRLVLGQWLTYRNNEFQDSPHKDLWTGPFRTKDIQDEYITDVGNYGDGSRRDKTKLGIAIKKIFPTSRKEQIYYNGKQEAVYFFPALDKSREQFEAYTRQKFDWPQISDAPEEPF